MSKNETKVVNELFNVGDNKIEDNSSVENNTNKKINTISNVEEKQNIESKDSLDEKKSATISKEEFEKIKQQLDENKKWGHETAQTYTLAKKRLKEIADEWEENGIIYEEDKKSLIEIFNKEMLEDEKNNVKEKDNSDDTIIQKLSSESENYKKYNKGKDVENDLLGFYKSFDHFSSKQKKDIKEYLLEAEPVEALERAITIGKDYNDTLDKNIEKHGDFLKYVKYLKSENEKLQNKLKDTSKKLDSSYGNIENSNITSRYSSDLNENNKLEDKSEVVRALFG